MIYVAFLLFYSVSAFGQNEKLPAAIQVDKNTSLIASAYAQGVQVYTCQRDPKNNSQYVWQFKEPRATLYADSTHRDTIGKHYFDDARHPTWKYKDGSMVVGSKMEQVNSPDNLAVPWLLLKATNTQGAGVLKLTTFIQRVFTKGGKAPAIVEKPEIGKTIEVPYTAVYLFYGPVHP